MDRFSFEKTEDCPLGEYVLIADPRFRVEPQDDSSFVVVEVSRPGSIAFRMQHHGRHGELVPALDQAAARADPILPREKRRKRASA